MSAAARPNRVVWSTPNSAISVRAPLRAEALGEQPTGIGVAPEAARRADRIGAREQRAAARVLRRALERERHQRERLAGPRRVRFALRDGPGSDQEGSSGIQRHGSALGQREQAAEPRL